MLVYETKYKSFRFKISSQKFIYLFLGTTGWVIVIPVESVESLSSSVISSSYDMVIIYSIDISYSIRLFRSHFLKDVNNKIKTYFICRALLGASTSRARSSISNRYESLKITSIMGLCVD